MYTIRCVYQDRIPLIAYSNAHMSSGVYHLLDPFISAQHVQVVLSVNGACARSLRARYVLLSLIATPSDSASFPNAFTSRIICVRIFSSSARLSSSRDVDDEPNSENADVRPRFNFRRDSSVFFIAVRKYMYLPCSVNDDLHKQANNRQTSGPHSRILLQRRTSRTHLSELHQERPRSRCQKRPSKRGI